MNNHKLYDFVDNHPILSFLVFPLGFSAVFIVTLIFFLSKTDQQINESIRANLASGGKTIGQLNDGRSITRYCIEVRNGMHYIYVVDNASTVSTNFSVRRGKTEVNETHVLVNQAEAE